MAKAVNKELALTPTETAVDKLSTSERVQRAKEKSRKLADRVSGLLSLAEQNALIVYSPLLSVQIPRSFAANAFNVFQAAMHRQEIVQTCTYWDKPDPTLNHNAIPTVYALIRSDDVLDAISEEVRHSWPLGSGDAATARSSLESICDEISAIMRSDLLASVKNLRDKHFAHALDATRAEMSRPIAPMKYGDERILLEKTTDLVERLYLWITGTSFDLSENRSMHRRHAEEFWQNCKFSITRR